MNDKHFLEEDPSIFVNNLLIKDDPISKLLQRRDGKKDDEIPFKMVRPSAGFCIKTHTLEGDKVFMNICYTEDIPEPDDISDAELIEILESDEPSSFRVPMSIGNLHVEVDKGGNLCSVYDIAINCGFFNKIITNELFKTFFITVVMEGLEEKYSLALTLREAKPYHIVKNRKSLGTLQMHRIQQRPVRKDAKPLLQEITSTTNKAKIVELSSKDVAEDKTAKETNKKPINGQDEKNGCKEINKSEVSLPKKMAETSTDIKYSHPLKHPMAVDEKTQVRLFGLPNNKTPEKIVVFVKFRALSGTEINLDISEDRIVVISTKHSEFFDFYLPVRVNPEKSTAVFCVNLQVLKLILPLIKFQESVMAID